MHKSSFKEHGFYLYLIGKNAIYDMFLFGTFFKTGKIYPIFGTKNG